MIYPTTNAMKFKYIGQPVKVRAHLKRSIAGIKTNIKAKWFRRPFMRPKYGKITGFTYKYNGTINKEYDDVTTYYTVAYNTFVQEETIPVVLVRFEGWMREEFILPEDVEEMIGVS